ncbi:MAG: AzlC family ABC transporter permease [Beijerinckiaceae bacterium]
MLAQIMMPSSTALPSSSWTAAFTGARDALGLPAITICFSLIGIGGLARDIGYPLLAGMLSSALMWAGPAQVLLFGSIGAGVALPVVAVAVLFSSLRFMPMTISIIPLLNEPKKPLWKLLLAAHLVSITNWVEGMRRLPDIEKNSRYPYFCGFGMVVLGSGTLATGVGYFLVGALPGSLAAALLFTTPMFFAVNLIAAVKKWPDLLPIILAIVLTPVAAWLVGRDYDLVAAGLAGGTLAYVIDRQRRKNASARGGL